MESASVKRQFEGIVVGDKMAKTIVVRVDRTKLHARYGKRYAVSRKYKVHDEREISGVGDAVVFEECRPLSKDKRWRLIKILKEGTGSPTVLKDEIEVLKKSA